MSASGEPRALRTESATNGMSQSGLPAPEATKVALRYPEDIVGACDRWSLWSALEQTFSEWDQQGWPRQLSVPYSFRVVSCGNNKKKWDFEPSPMERDDWTGFPAQARERIVLELIVDVCVHIYVWRMCFPTSEMWVPDPARLMDEFESNRVQRWENAEHLGYRIRRVRRIRLCDVDVVINEPPFRANWHVGVKPFLEALKLPD